MAHEIPGIRLRGLNRDAAAAVLLFWPAAAGIVAVRLAVLNLQVSADRQVSEQRWRGHLQGAAPSLHAAKGLSVVEDVPDGVLGLVSGLLNVRQGLITKTFGM